MPGKELSGEGGNGGGIGGGVGGEVEEEADKGQEEGNERMKVERRKKEEGGVRGESGGGE